MNYLDKDLESYEAYLRLVDKYKNEPASPKVCISLGIEVIPFIWSFTLMEREVIDFLQNQYTRLN